MSLENWTAQYRGDTRPCSQPTIEDRLHSIEFQMSLMASRLGVMVAPAPPPNGRQAEPHSFPAARAKMARQLIRQRRMREEFFAAELFAEPAWDMLLDLYAARLDRRLVSVSSLCIAAAVPGTTALRWIKTMTDAGLFLREADPHDGRRIYLMMSDEAFEAMGRYFDQLSR